MKKLLYGALLLILISAVLAGCSGGDSKGSKAKDGEQVVLKLGHIQSESDLWHEGALKFKEEVEKLSDGSMTVEIYPNSTLGGDRDMAEGMQMGTIDFALIAGVLSNFEPSIQLLELPYLLENEEEYNKVVHGEVGQEIADRVLESSNIRILNWWDRGPRHVTANKPIETLEDVKGLKIRIPEIKAMEDTWNAMGAAPTTMAWNEVYTGLEQGTIEAQENPIPFTYGGRIHEVQKYLSLTAHKYEYVTLAMSENTFSKLTAEQQEIIKKAGDAATEFENNLVKEETGKILEKMKEEGLQVVEPNVAEFAEAAKAAHEKFAKTVDIDLYNKILEAKK
ncbi:TRAP transporter substrate-binding protein [Ornithinibacillus bavariensis]|uniref:C4-dicarboxylate ABC transporter substrate-binding protein n=1 Tax=Ornithinibacillus bavariensis TaxID=545502 RepID=A0A919XCN5_9BACI|nr:TRAP transporter substrate-binding protein [Ornithinibacillus bavariensis]GIO28113.1 C4-dicarboxylate ABC transporter substrate-binding protein [Ornithinibacillus bavariensis]HAM80899.1 C4-dicarboxylate ABC transporter substrate-binding protein [Ornithinibacillus sp.]